MTLVGVCASGDSFDLKIDIVVHDAAMSFLMCKAYSRALKKCHRTFTLINHNFTVLK